MNYYIKFRNQTLGPFSKEQVQELFLQNRFDDSVRLSTNLSKWYPPAEMSDFQLWLERHPLPKGNVVNGYENHPRQIERRQEKQSTHGLFIFLTACLVIILGFGTVIYWIDKTGSTGEQEIVSVGPSKPQGDHAVSYQKFQTAIALVTMTYINKFGDIGTKPVGTAFAISPNTFVTNAHVAFSVKNDYTKLVESLFWDSFYQKAEENHKSPAEYYQQIGDRGMDRLWEETQTFVKDMGIRVRDVELRLNHTHGKSFRIASVQVHPKYNTKHNTAAEEFSNAEFDVALFKIDGETECFFQIASEMELENLYPGLEVASSGFPMEGLHNGDVNINYPEASYSKGVIKKLTNFELVDAGAQYNRSITHDIPGAGGASGSPMFTGDGKVIGVLWGVEMAVDGNGNRTPFAALQNRAVRIDQIEQMSEPVPWKEWINQ